MINWEQLIVSVGRFPLSVCEYVLVRTNELQKISLIEMRQQRPQPNNRFGILNLPRRQHSGESLDAG